MELAQRHQAISDCIAQACDRAQRDPDSVQLMAVTKYHPPSTVDELADLGVTLFGENRVQEAKSKISLCNSRVTWHMIGHLQTNKVRDAVAMFAMIQGVDSLRVASEISRRAEQSDRTMPILLEVNVGGEASKSGYGPDSLLSELNELAQLPALEIQGLMTIPPWKPVAEQARPYFRSLHELRLRCEDSLSVPLPHLSMGMSNDFEVAIEEGATIVRIGTALLGERPKRKP